MSRPIVTALMLAVVAVIPATAQLTDRDLWLADRELTKVNLKSVQVLRVINMIPNAQSGETRQDSEPNIAVNPANPRNIVASAFTRNPSGATATAPIFVSSDTGTTWTMNSIVPSGNGMTGDISVDFARDDSTLYTGILRGGSGLRQMILRSANPFGATAMTVLTDHSTEDLDQPYVSATTFDDSGTNRDRVYVGFNEYDNRSAAGGTGRTASAEYSLDARTAPPPAGFTTTRIEARNTAGQDMPAVRFAVHESGVIYGVFYRWTSGNLPNAVCDVVVVRDDNFAAGANPFADLTDSSDGIAGRIVVSGRTVPAFPASLGQNRLVASNLSIAVDPSDASVVYLAWADRVGIGDYTLHLRRSDDSGETWSADIMTATDATNPALAVDSGGRVGFLYQQLTGPAGAERWKTNFRVSSDSGWTWRNYLLADTPDNQPAPTFQPYTGDYVDLIAIRKSFYGVFSASNVPDNDNFPSGVTYLRNANFTTNTLIDTDGTTAVATSIDPFFFRLTTATIVRLCDIAPQFCPDIRIREGLIEFECLVRPCYIVDPIPKNCLAKFDCPGCEGTALCPPWYHIFIEDIDPRVWDIGIFTSRGDEVRHEVRRLKEGVVVSFRPSKKMFRPGEIGDYVLGFAAEELKPGEKFTFRTRLEVSDYPDPGRSRSGD